MAVDLDAQREAVLGALVRAMRSDEASRARLLGVKGRALAAATETNLSVRTGPTLPAIERYTGVLYDALDAASLPPALRRGLDRSVVVISGLWGAVSPADPVPDYKLKMGARLPAIGVLSAWWRADLSAALTAVAGRRRVWNLLPNEHAAAWQPVRELPQWNVRFLDHAPDGGLVAVSHRNKALKGVLVRYLVANTGAEPDDLTDPDLLGGYAIDRSLDDARGEVRIVSLVARG
jgi:cytoplasmic iron level regulating protein YaaA (DUF328/UPF0246 family)